MTTIYLIRHAEAEGNLYRRIHGHYDSCITVRGYKQLEQLEARFKGVHVDAVYASDLCRARTTAGAIYKRRALDLRVKSELREVCMGVWEDKTWGEVERYESEQLFFFNNDPMKWSIEGAEDFIHLQKRLTDAIFSIAKKHVDESIAIVSHGSAIRAFMCGIMGISPHEIQRLKHYDNTAVSVLHIDGGNVQVALAGDNSHLPQELSTFAHQKWWRENTTFDSTNVRFTPFDLNKDAQLYLQYRHNVKAEQNRLLDAAKKRQGVHPRAVSLAQIGDTPVGLIELAVDTNADEHTGIIEFIYLGEDQRQTGLSAQLLGQAVSVYRSLGRQRLRIDVQSNDVVTLGFCRKYGFQVCTDTERDTVSLELDISVC